MKSITDLLLEAETAPVAPPDDPQSMDMKEPTEQLLPFKKEGSDIEDKPSIPR